MHLSLLISFYTKYSFNYLDLVVLAVILSILFIFQKSEKWDLGTEKTLLSIYSFFVALMASKAISIAITIKSIHAILIGLGGLCFIVSDIVLGVWSYYSNKD